MGRRSYHREDPLVGTFCVEVMVPTGKVLYGSANFHVGGTFSGMDSGDIGQPFIDPNGQLLTTWAGSWKRICRRKYKFFLTNVINAPGPNLPATPVNRLKVEGILKLSRDKQRFVIKADGTIYDVKDITLSKPTSIGPIIVVGDRIGFKI